MSLVAAASRLSQSTTALAPLRYRLGHLSVRFGQRLDMPRAHNEITGPILWALRNDEVFQHAHERFQQPDRHVRFHSFEERIGDVLAKLGGARTVAENIADSLIGRQSISIGEVHRSVQQVTGSFPAERGAHSRDGLEDLARHSITDLATRAVEHSIACANTPFTSMGG